MQPKPQNARFWIFHNLTWSKITLKPGQEISHYSKEKTDEGYSAEWFSLSLDGDLVTYETGSDGRDCDGRISHSETLVCAVDNLHSRPAEPILELVSEETARTHYRFSEKFPTEDNFGFYVETGYRPALPEWIRESRYYRDEFAELANY